MNGQLMKDNSNLIAVQTKEITIQNSTHYLKALSVLQSSCHNQWWIKCQNKRTTKHYVLRRIIIII